MARIVALIPDLMFGSKVREMLGAAGHEVELCAGEAEAWSRLESGADVLVVDLTSDLVDGIGFVDTLRAGHALSAARTLGFFAHVEVDVRERAQAVGFDLVVPRSRMAREAGALVAGLAAG